MDVLEFIASLVQSLAWPAALVVALYLMRASVAKLFESLAKRIQTGNIRVEGAGWKALVSESLEDATEALQQIPAEIRASESTNSVRENGLDSEWFNLATTDPEAAVLKCWTLVEHALRGYAARQDFHDLGTSPRRMATRMAMGGLLKKEIADAIVNLWMIRSIAAHEYHEIQAGDIIPDSINRANALAFVITGQRVIAYLDGETE